MRCTNSDGYFELCVGLQIFGCQHGRTVDVVANNVAEEDVAIFSTVMNANDDSLNCDETRCEVVVDWSRDCPSSPRPAAVDSSMMLMLCRSLPSLTRVVLTTVDLLSRIHDTS